MNHIIPLLVAFMSTYGFIAICYKFAVSINLVDRPNNRKNHQGVIPVIGGIAVVFGFSLACLLSSRVLTEWRPLFLCIIPLVVVGVMDDHGDISISKRVGMQIISCLVMIYYGNVRINNFGDLAGFGNHITFGGLESVITVFCVVGVINALNLIDGIDGLCASLCLVAFGGIFALAKLTGTSVSVSLLLYFSAALFAFLIVNLGLTQRIVKKVFLGDAGTTIIGFFLCWHLIRMSNGDNAVFRPITAVWLLALPIMDTLAVMIRRIRLNKSPFLPGRDHIHHQLMNFGLSSRRTLVILVVVSMLLVGVGVLCEVKDVAEPFMFYGILILFGLYYAGSEKLNRHTKINRVDL
jgi:UDP-GlcNAc:undecaprenyl-phosphate/decaprenyl-phosphate GlcNAc-1-phosphate transferase